MRMLENFNVRGQANPQAAADGEEPFVEEEGVVVSEEGLADVPAAAAVAGPLVDFARSGPPGLAVFRPGLFVTGRGAAFGEDDSDQAFGDTATEK